MIHGPYTRTKAGRGKRREVRKGERRGLPLGAESLLQRCATPGQVLAFRP